MKWSDVFTDINFKYRAGEERKACVDGLMGWAMCESGSKQPENFGRGMVTIGNFLEITPLADNLMKYSDKFTAKTSKQ